MHHNRRKKIKEPRQTDRKRLSQTAIKVVGIFIVMALIASAIMMFTTRKAHASDGEECHGNCGPSTTQVFTKKNVIVPGAAIVAAGVAAYCVTKRVGTWFNAWEDTCIDDVRSATGWKQTNKEDDYVTPPTIDVNTRR